MVPWIAAVNAGAFPFLAKQVKRRAGVADAAPGPPQTGRRPDVTPDVPAPPVRRNAQPKPTPPPKVVAFQNAYRISGPDDLWPVRRRIHHPPSCATHASHFCFPRLPLSLPPRDTFVAPCPTRFAALLAKFTRSRMELGLQCSPFHLFWPSLVALSCGAPRLVLSDCLQVYKLRDGKTAIIAITEFTAFSYYYFVAEFIKAFATVDE